MLKELEQRLEGDRFKLCALLGIHEQSYYKYRQGNPIPEYVTKSAWAHMQLSNAALKRRLKEVLK